MAGAREITTATQFLQVNFCINAVLWLDSEIPVLLVFGFSIIWLEIYIFLASFSFFFILRFLGLDHNFFHMLVIWIFFTGHL